jgi:hypothetical protein
MTRQFFDNTQPKNWLLNCMVQNMQPNQAGIKLSTIHRAAFPNAIEALILPSDEKSCNLKTRICCSVLIGLQVLN